MTAERVKGSIPSLDALQVLPEAAVAARLLRLIEGSSGYFIGRIGGSDYDALAYYVRSVYGPSPLGRQELALDDRFHSRMDLVKRWNGYYDRGEHFENSVRFCEQLLAQYAAFDIAAVGNAQLLSAIGMLKPGEYGYETVREQNFYDALLERTVRYELFNYHFVEDMQGFLLQVFPALIGRRVLVCSPFTESIRHQFAKKDELFRSHPDGPFCYPDFELVTLRTPVTYKGARAFPHRDWFETGAVLCDELYRLKFDVALLGCGSYALPLGACVKSLGKGAIYMGGVLQFYFGITGRRYLANDYYTRYMNEHWIRPKEPPDVAVTDSDAQAEGYAAYW